MAWHSLGWVPSFFSEIEAFPRAVLEHHYPEVPVHGDFTTIGADQHGSIDLLVGGTPCQSFSIAGLRKGLDDDRGNLALEFLRLAQRKQPKWIVWENVPGVLSSNGGRDFGSFLGALVELGYGFAYRVCDAQWWGVAQRRRRVFVVGYLGDWKRPAAVLFEREGLFGDSPPSREEGEKVAPAVTTGPPFSRTGNERVECEAIVPMQAFQVANCLTYRMHKGINTTVDEGQTPVLEPYGVRRLTPTECERLQGFPDNFTQIPYRNKSAENCPDGPRYKALGNSMAVPVMKWIGERIQQVEGIQ